MRCAGEIAADFVSVRKNGLQLDWARGGDIVVFNRKGHEIDRIHVTVTGGRKAMSQWVLCTMSKYLDERRGR